MTKTGPNRRRFPRIPAECDILLRRAQGKEIPAVSTVHDMGLGGCRFESKESLGENSTLWITILPKKGIVEAKARVAYELPEKGGTFEIGVEFLEISDRDKAHLETLLAADSPREDRGRGPGR